VSDLYPLRLTPAPKERIWGATNLQPYFGEFTQPIGEIWYSFEENSANNGPLANRSLASLMTEFGARLMGTEHQPQTLVRQTVGRHIEGNPGPTGPYFPILAKMLFAETTLSVQVHPDDVYALQHEGGPGKTELWYVAAAKEGAAVALGLTKEMTPAELADAARSGQIEQVLNWIPVQQGDALFIPPGTLHTLGAGVTICEIQQNSDLTYRFFDFGRTDAAGNARELHVEKGAQVVRMDAPNSKLALTTMAEETLERCFLASCDYFEVETLKWIAPTEFSPDPRRFDLLVFLEGEGRIGTDVYRPGDCYLIPASADTFELQPDSPSTAIRTFVPAI
jgi:mannose-6-phosphate isomerase